MTSDYGYHRAIRRHIEQDGMEVILENEIPLPGLPESRSQLAVPILGFGRLLGVCFLESSEDLRFGYDEEDALVALAAQLGIAIHAVQQLAETSEELAARESEPVAVARSSAGASLCGRRHDLPRERLPDQRRGR
jgi:adenylate cyclase